MQCGNYAGLALFAGQDVFYGLLQKLEGASFTGQQMVNSGVNHTFINGVGRQTHEIGRLPLPNSELIACASAGPLREGLILK